MECVAATSFGPEPAIKVVPWDWHYRVGFDEHVRQAVFQYGANLPHAYRVAFETELASYSSFASISGLLDAIDEVPAAASRLVDSVASNRLAHVPSSLASLLADRIGSMSLPPAIATKLLSLLAAATKIKYQNPHRSIFEPAFGAQLTKLARTHVERASTIRQKVPAPPMNAREQIAVLLKEYSTFLKRQYRADATLDFRVEELKGDGTVYAEYWSAHLLGEPTDKLILYEHARENDLDEQNATLIHEIFGHGFFYQLERRIKPRFVDHGAIAFVEGWATAVEWLLSPKSYATYYMTQRSQTLRMFDEVDSSKILESLDSLYQAYGYSKGQRATAILNFFQYPGYGYSYTLGGIWFSRLLSTQDFFTLVRDKPWGNFFSCYAIDE